MAWSSLLGNQFVSYNDAKTSDISQIGTLPTSDGWMTKSNATTYLSVDSAKLSGFTASQYVTKDILIFSKKSASTIPLGFQDSYSGTIITQTPYEYFEQMPILIGSGFTSGYITLNMSFHCTTSVDGFFYAYAVKNGVVEAILNSGNIIANTYYDVSDVQVIFGFGTSVEIRIGFESDNYAISFLDAYTTIESATITTGQVIDIGADVGPLSTFNTYNISV